MKYILYIASICSLLLACEEKPASGPGTIATKPTLMPVTAPSGTPVAARPVPVANITTAGSSKLNPAHGQPGHRCDIAVGAPLPAGGSVQNATPALASSSVINPVAQPVTTTTAQQPNVVTSATVAPGINPAHGQPGHRCDVAVGAVIPKTAASSASTAATSSPVVNQPVLQNSPILPQTGTIATTVANGLNPAHGQPGHRCDIEVGKPLNSAPKKK